MNEPKVPDSDTDWQTVDIFLFSNGQKQTPPRKYHLASEDLSRWSSTLMSLAHEHYGSVLSSIDLYTLEGERVQNPMQISNGNAYVAVPPQDTFIPSGYEDYLLRASRSREKRQGKLQNNVQVELQQDEFDRKIQTTEIEDKEVEENVEILNDDVNVATSTVGDQVNTTSIVLPQHSTRRNTIRPPEKLSSNQNSTILRKQNSAIPQPMIRKTSMKLKENPLRKNLKVNTMKGTNNGSTIITNGNNQFRTNTKSITKTGKGIDRESILRNSNDRSKIEPRISILGKAISSTEKTFTTDNIALENIIDDNELIVVKKQDSENRSIMYSELDKSGIVYTPRHTRLSSVVPILMPIEESKVSTVIKEEPPVTVINNLIENVYKSNNDVTNNDVTSKNKSKLQIDGNIQEQQEDKINFSKKPPVDSFIAVIEKGDVVNLNLKLEVKKCEGVINAKDSKQMNSITEKGSQVNVGQEIVESIQKRSNPTNKLTVDEDNPKVVVIQCSCCQSHNLNDLLHKIDTESVKLDDKKYVVLLPDPQSDQSVKRNQCTHEESSETEKSINDPRASVINPVKKVFATTSVQRLKTMKIPPDIANTESNLNSYEENALDKRQAVDITRNLSSIQKLYSANSAIPSKQTNNSKNTFVDDSTQTEWFTMVLEARRHDDGRYSFYLPPLHVLKYYGL